MVLSALKQLKPTKFIIINSFCFYYFAQKLIPGAVLALRLLLAVFVLWTCPRWYGGPQNPHTNPNIHSQQLLFQQVYPKIDPWGRLRSRGPEGPGGLWGCPSLPEGPLPQPGCRAHCTVGDESVQKGEVSHAPAPGDSLQALLAQTHSPRPLVPRGQKSPRTPITPRSPRPKRSRK